MFKNRALHGGAGRAGFGMTQRKYSICTCFGALLLTACNGQTVSDDGYGIRDLIITNQVKVDSKSTGSIGPVENEAYPNMQRDLLDGHLVSVDREDTLEDLSERYGIPVRSILAANQKDNSRFQLGNTVFIPYRCEPFCHEYVYH